MPPNIDESKYKKKITVVVNEAVSMNCPVNAIPEPEISWLANGQLIAASGPPVRDIRLSPDGSQVC